MSQKGQAQKEQVQQDEPVYFASEVAQRYIQYVSAVAVSQEGQKGGAVNIRDHLSEDDLDHCRKITVLNLDFNYYSSSAYSPLYPHLSKLKRMDSEMLKYFESVERISDGAFSCMTSLEQIDFGSVFRHVKSLGGTFLYKTAVRHLNLSSFSELESIGNTAFSEMPNLKEIDLRRLKNLKHIGLCFAEGTDAKILGLETLTSVKIQSKQLRKKARMFAFLNTYLITLKSPTLLGNCLFSIWDVRVLVTKFLLPVK